MTDRNHELLYEVSLKMTGMTDFGTTLEQIQAEGPPPQGARLDISFEGEAIGPKVKGKVTGVDYANVRGDGRFELDIYATVETVDGARIAFKGGGHAEPQEDGTLNIHEYGQWRTSHPDYSWLNGKTALGEGSGNVATGEIKLKLFAL